MNSRVFSGPLIKRFALNMNGTVLVTFAFLVMVVSGAKRDRVVIKGVTMPPGFTRRVGNGHYCCKHYLRKSGSGFDGGELLYSDPPEACRNDAIVQVSSEDSDQKYKQNDNALTSLAIECPADRPFSFNRGFHCCKYFRRKKDTSVHGYCNGGYLQQSDPLACCHGDDAIPCPSAEHLCKDQADARKYCPARTDFIRGNGDKGYKVMGESTMNFHEVESTCASNSATSMQFKTPGEYAAAKEALQLTGDTTPSGLRSTSSGTCQNTACDVKVEWLDGTPFKWTSLLGFDVIKDVNTASCYKVDWDQNKLKDQWCTNSWYRAMCEVSCHP